jgi:TetR/AcrR family transcriptional regulator, ethionamide resistance regulator
MRSIPRMSSVPDDPGSTAAPPRRQPGGPAKGDRRRQAIVDAVEQLLQEKTIAELSVENIAAAAGISRSGFYFYFESKYAALGDALSDVADAMSGAADDFFAGTERAPQEYVNDALGGVAALWRRHAPLMIAVVDAAHSDAGARALWDNWRRDFVLSIAERIEVERAAGRAPADGGKPEELGRALLAMNLGLLDDDARRGASDAEAERTVAAMTTVWLSTVWGLRPDGPLGSA